jgi:hypothetical protein
MIVRNALLSSVAALSVLAAAGAVSAQNGPPPRAERPVVSVDARSTLSPGLRDAGQAASGLTLEYSVAPPPGFFDPDALWGPPQSRAEAEAVQARNRENPPRFTPLALANSDMAMADGKLFMGSFHGFNAYDVTQGEPRLVMSVVCPGGQGDVSVHGDLLFMSVEENRARLDCGVKNAEGEVNAERFRGVRIFDISNLNAPRQVAAVQTCRGSHTHTLVPGDDPNVLYIYGQGTSGVRKTDELGICSDGQPGENPETALFSIDVIKVPLDRPQDAAIVNRPRIFADRETGEIAGLWRGGRVGVASQEAAQTNQCHDITVYPEMKLAAGACAGNGILLDITDPQNPTRVSELFDPDMAYWHSATFNNAGDKVLFTDEWGGGTSARCRAEDPETWGADLIATIKDGRTLEGHSFFKLPSVQGKTENCVAHNGNVLPVPGRDLMVQAWYQGGVSIVDFTDPMKPFEVAYFDRGPIDAERLVVGGAWSAYWLNGRIYVSEIVRGLDVLKLEPSELLSAAEIAAAESVTADVINPQTQVRAVWTDSPDVAAAYLDQLSRSQGIEAGLADRVRSMIEQWRGGAIDKAQAAELSQALATAPEGAASADAARFKALSDLFGRQA